MFTYFRFLKTFSYFCLHFLFLQIFSYLWKIFIYLFLVYIFLVYIFLVYIFLVYIFIVYILIVYILHYILQGKVWRDEQFNVRIRICWRGVCQERKIRVGFPQSFLFVLKKIAFIKFTLYLFSFFVFLKSQLLNPTSYFCLQVILKLFFLYKIFFQKNLIL